ncbi:MAG TPA: ubiquitin-like domain-containing protein [Nocardioidaceae bacterium]|nr:ubiquitin-like domain-containing protein [Nocardioidaceae bacterium]
MEVFVRRSLQLSLFAVVLLGLIGGTLAFFVAQKSVTLTVDGQVRHVGTYADTVGDVLDDEGLRPAAHDVLLPAAGDALRDGDTVVLNRARPLQLTVDGVSRQVYVTALSVDEALGQLGYRADGLVLSASRSERLPLRGMDLTITTPKQIDLIADGQERVVTTTAATAGDLLAEQGIALSQTDRTSLYLNQGLLNRMRLQVYRVQINEVSETTAVPHDKAETPDPNAFVGDRTVTTPGVDGQKVTRYKVTVVDGVETSREVVDEKVTVQPVTEQATVGTKPKPTVAPTADGLNWTALAKCESGGNPQAVNPAGYYGLYQFSLSTWRSVGGSGNPTDASPAEQTARAQTLYARGGAGQWGCGRHLFD